MRLSQKLVLFVLAASVAPLSLGGFWVLGRAEAELARRLESEQRALAAAAAEATGTQLSGTLDGLGRSAGLIDWSAASPEEALGGLRLLAGQSTLVVAAAYVEPSSHAPPPSLLALEGRPACVDDVAQLTGALPLQALGAWGDRGLVALGPVQRSAAGRWLPVAIQVGERGDAAAMLALALALEPLDGWLVAHASELATLEVVDGEGRVVASSRAGAGAEALAAGRLDVLRARVALAVRDGEQVATAAVPGQLGLSAVASVPLKEARAPVLALRRVTLWGLGLVLTLLLTVALGFVRSLTRRLGAMTEVARDFGRGDLSRRVEASGADELSLLGSTFNAMGAELEAARGKLLRWNDELRQRVDEALADLRAAQAQLLEAQKLAAIGQLGAGVAHEINNPLVAILGNAQLLLMDRSEGDGDFGLLKQIEDGARRCRDITQHLLRFSQTRGEVRLAPVDLVAVTRSALEFEAPRHEAAGVEVRAELPDAPVRIDGDAEQLQQVISQLCDNARTAMAASETKRLTVRVAATEGGATLEVEDTGKGIDPSHLERVFEPFFTTKDVWTNIGLGLSVVYRVIEEHQGRVEVHATPGRGARFTITLKAEGTTAPRSEAEPLSRRYGGVGQGVGS